MKSDVETDSVGMSQVFTSDFLIGMQPFVGVRGIYGVGHYIVTKVTFLNDSQLFIEYYSNPEEGERWESRQEIIDLPF